MPRSSFDNIEAQGRTWKKKNAYKESGKAFGEVLRRSLQNGERKDFSTVVKKEPKLFGRRYHWYVTSYNASEQN